MFPYEGLLVYKKAFFFNQKLYRLIRGNSGFAPYIKNQLGRAGLSIMLNIAEGSAKTSNKDRKNFFIISRGSAFECSSIVCFMYEEGEIQEEIKDQLYSLLDEISRILYTMIKNLG